ncbi:MAG: hypothetical protein LBJ71_00450 [Holosporaceae bacterium]|jgi:hypothetical protein|nr:hypothetical protein [Holosporaceae bacterium]
MKQSTRIIAAAILFLNSFVYGDNEENRAEIYINPDDISVLVVPGQDPKFLASELNQLVGEEREEVIPLINEVFGRKNPDQDKAYHLGEKLEVRAFKLQNDENVPPLENAKLSDFGINEETLSPPFKKVANVALREDVSKLTRLERALRLHKGALIFYQKAGKGEEVERKIKGIKDYVKDLEKLVKEEKAKAKAEAKEAKAKAKAEAKKK